jgi:hypothetical protein
MKVLDERSYDKLPIVPIDGTKPKSEKEEKFLKEVVEYEFINTEEPGLIQKFPYGDTKNKQVFTFLHGGKYRVPRHVARWVESRQTPQWKWIPDGRGSLQKQLQSFKPRFQMRAVFGS